MKTSILVAFATLLGPCIAVPAARSNTHSLHEKRDGVPIEWSKRSRAHAANVLPVRIGLRQRNLEHAERYIEDVSNPSSPNFGKHWTAEQVANTFAPLKETTDQVTEWLATSGVNRDRITFSKGRNWVEFNATVDEIEHLLDTQYHFYQHKTSKGWRVACDSYSLPHGVKEHVDFIMPTIQLDGMRPVAQLKPSMVHEVAGGGGLTGLKNCSNLITIECLRALYQFPAGSTNETGNEMGIGEWADYLYEPDLPLFFQNFTKPEIPSDTRPEFISIDGGKHSNLTQAKEGNVIESALDFQTAYSIVYPQGIRLYQNGDGVNVDSVGTFNIFLDALDASYCTYEGGDAPYVDPEYPDPNLGGYTGPLQCGGAPLSHVFSFSYNQIEGALPRFYQQRQCHEWMKLGLQGVSVLFASGDSGVANRYNAGYENSCLNDKNLYVDTNGTRYSPSFPTNCPYVTAVGATTLLGNTVFDGEQAVADPDPNNTKLDFYSGGGFSNVFELPSYQAEAVTNYLAKYPEAYPHGENIFNTSGKARAYPDVSAIGLNVVTVYLGQVLGVGGTSASTPIVAGIITLLNEARLCAGKGPIGFLNSVFYSHPEMFNDVTVGSNPGCGSSGFNATPGWDPVTGLGTPNYPKMKEVFLSLP